MAKIKVDVMGNEMAMFIMCEAIGSEQDLMDFHADENGEYDIKIIFNGKELNVERFIDNLQKSYQDAVNQHAADLLSVKYDKIVREVNEIQKTLEFHNDIFDEKVHS